MTRLRGDHAHSDTLDTGFDLTDAGQDDFGDAPTELPEPWSPPPDAEFLTGTMPALDPADLSEGLEPGLEPSDSPQATERLSRELVRALVAARIRAQSVSGTVSAAPAPAPRAITADPAPPLSGPVAVPSGLRAVIAHRWQLHHVAFAFSMGVLAGVLTCILAMR